MGNLLSRFLFQPPVVAYTHPQSRLFWIKTVDGRDIPIPAIFINHNAKVTVLYSHGNAEDLGSTYEWFCAFAARLNINVFLFEYEGYGLTRPHLKPNELSCYADIDAAFSYLTNDLSIPTESIVLYGRSLGSGPTCYLAERLCRTKTILGGVVLEV